MNIIKINITFLLTRNRLNKMGKCSLRCRITYLQKRQEFATGLFINPNHWYSNFQLAKPPNEENIFINTELSLIKQKINQAFLFLQINEINISVEDIYKQYKGKTLDKEFGVIEAYNQYIERIKKLIDIEIQMVTYKKYIESRNHLLAFVVWKFKVKDFKFRELNFNFITDYEYFLKTEKNLQQSTLNKAIQRFRKVMQFAISQNYLDKDPFLLYKAKRIKKEIIFLTNEELKALENQQFEIKRIEQIKDLFVFCCYTGLAFNEMTNLKKSHVVKGFDGGLWLNINRAKTLKSYKIPLLNQAKVILDKYENGKSEKVFPKISNPKFNAYLKEIADVVGIPKNLTHHVARKTFATTVLLFNDVSMEIVSELLGHSKLSTTQEHYAKVVQSKVSDSMRILANKLK
ncbi:site-specific integrase [Flavobacterium sp. GT3R68]|uniref:site-specific integrase n=1 Tax=Flavobacterium sp. GT3R68 TaxID=2594437 RepID=UPI000F88B625|nr:site-specific integrase [Flavobacterium sp. GT3R68]RTY86208.1 site-specific integrase [Flavobacterium sp. GSN2]TRW94012.1 site-specific integrase [Flavobacterium sp. GT3R68]